MYTHDTGRIISIEYKKQALKLPAFHILLANY